MTSINSLGSDFSRPGSKSINIHDLDEVFGNKLALGNELRAGRDSIWSQSDNGSISGDDMQS